MPAMQIIEQVHDHFAGPKIQVPGRFISQKYAWGAHK
jgi:hypothetical protein